MSFISKSINRKLVFMFIGVTLIPLAIVISFSAYRVVDVLKNEEVQHLNSARQNKANEIYDTLKKYLEPKWINP